VIFLDFWTLTFPTVPPLPRPSGLATYQCPLAMHELLGDGEDLVLHLHVDSFQCDEQYTEICAPKVKGEKVTSF